jgi:hypothetical protein
VRPFKSLLRNGTAALIFVRTEPASAHLNVLYILVGLGLIAAILNKYQT